MQQKVDPVLLRLIEEQQRLDSTTSTGPSKSDSNKAANKRAEKTFDCIVYTTNAEILRDNGITVNAVFPTFVTVMATPGEIERMVAMPSVRYIASSGRIEKETSQ